MLLRDKSELNKYYYFYFISMGMCTSAPTMYPTLNPLPFINNITFLWKKPFNNQIIGDAFARFEASVTIYIQKIFNLDQVCFECFKWFLKDLSDDNDEFILLNDYYSNSLVTIYNDKVGKYVGVDGDEYDIFESYLIITSIRTENSGYCVNKNESTTHLLQPENAYKFQIGINLLDNLFESDVISVTTRKLPSGGKCNIVAEDNEFIVFDKFNLQCSGWSGESLTYNALFSNVAMSSMFVSDASAINGIVGVGDVEIIALVKDSWSALTCYSFPVSFPSIKEIFGNNNNNENILINEIYNMMNETYSNDVAIALYSVITGLYQESKFDANTLSVIIEDLIDNIFDTAPMHNYSDIIFGEVLTSELTTISTIISNPFIVDSNTVHMLVTNYLQEIIDGLITNYSKDSTNKDIQTDLFSISISSQILIENIEIILTNSGILTSPTNVTNLFAEQLIDFCLYESHLALTHSFPGELFQYKSRHNKIVKAIKFKNTYYNNTFQQKCGFQNEELILPKSFYENNENNQLFDCVFLSSSSDNFVPSPQLIAYEPSSNIIGVEIYKEGATKSESVAVSRCDPYLITINLKNSTYSDLFEVSYNLNEKSAFPGCNFWNVSGWDDYGCFVYNFSLSGNYVTCGCIHLSSFRISTDSFSPKANLITEWHWRDFTIANLTAFPTVWISLWLLFTVFLFICLAFNQIKYKRKEELQHKDRSILAFEDIIFADIRDSRIKKDAAGFEIKYIEKYLPNATFLGFGMKKIIRGNDDNYLNTAAKSLCLLQLSLFSIYLRNDHSLLSAFQRTSGTNFSTQQRLGCLFMYLCNIMVATAAFYGVKQHNTMSDATASFLVSLFASMPVLIIKPIFVNSKPQIVERTMFVDEERDNMDIVDGDYDYEGMEEDDEEFADMARPHHAAVPSLSTALSYKHSMESIKKQRMSTPISTVNDLFGELKKSKDKPKQIKLVEDVRITLFHSVYPLPHKCKCIAWTILIIWTFMVCVIAISYGIQFDLDYDIVKNPNKAQTQYDGENDVNCVFANSKKEEIESYLTDRQISQNRNDIFRHFENDYIVTTESAKWILSCFQALILSIFVWQPLRIYIITWIKLHLFTWNLRMRLSPKNVYLLCMKCCRRNKNDINLRKEVSFDDYENVDNDRKSAYLMIANRNRPLDIIGYFCNDRLFLKLDQTAGKLKLLTSDVEVDSDDDIDLDTINENVDGDGDEEEEEEDEDDDVIDAEMIEMVDSKKIFIG